MTALAVRPAMSWMLCLGAAVCGGAGLSPNAAQRDQPVRIERTVFLMGTLATLVAESVDRETGLARLERMVRVIERTEAEISTWREDSVLGAVNRQPVGAPFPVPAASCGLLSRVAEWHAETNGAFDPAVGSLIDVWGLRREGRQPGDGELRAARAAAGLEHLSVDSEACTVTRRTAVTLDAGGFGKGEALDRVRAAERGRSGAWFIDFGGQMAVDGAASEGAWTVGIAHPARRGTSVLELALAAGSLATSGGSERDLLLDDGVRIGHVLDPRSGRPVSRAASVTVWHESAFVADVLSTALYVMGPDDGLAWASARGIAACFIAPVGGSGEAAFRATAAFEARFPRMSPSPPSPASRRDSR
jgi:thiamine biosynthesis lipoprotein